MHILSIKIENIISNALTYKVENFGAELKISDIGGWNSLVQAIIINDIEEEFNFKFKLRDLVSWKTIGELINTVEKYV